MPAFQCAICARGSGFRTALESSAQDQFGLVISDLGLPDMSGIEMMQQTRDSHGLKGIAESRVSGFVHHLTKPILIEKLSAILSNLD